LDWVHPSGLNERVVAKVAARRGRLHAYESLVPARTALVVIDLTLGSIDSDPKCCTVVEPINRLASTLRDAGGVVAWITPAPADRVNPGLVAIVGADRAQMFFEQARADNPQSALWLGLNTDQADLFVQKAGASAFFPGKCALPDHLRRAGVDTVLIVGTVTNVCCESSARDAVELGFRAIMVSDALAGHAFGLHEASLTTFYRIFGDVRPVDEVVDLIRLSAPSSD